MDNRSIPLFNKNVYSSNGAVVVTVAAREVMAKNACYQMYNRLDRTKEGHSSLGYQLSKSEMHSMHCVVDGLRHIHKDQSHIKEVLAHCATLESYGSHQNVTKKSQELQLSCHFILTGSVKVIYEVYHGDSYCDVTPTEELLDQPVDNMAESSIVYEHGAGEYLALLALEGIADGMPPASKICTLEPTELLRIDTKEFHERLQFTVSRIQDEIKAVVSNPRCVLSAVPREALDKILPHITKQRYPPHSDIIKQGNESNVMFCLAKGRCDITRTVYVPEARRKLCFMLGSVERYGLFCQECLLKTSPSTCTVTTTQQCTVLKINRLALEVVMKDQLYSILDQSFSGFPSDEKLQKIGHQACLWNQFKHLQVKQHLIEVGGQRLLLRPTTEKVQRKSCSKRENYPENLRRFILKGANFEPVTTRIRSAFIRRAPPRSSSATPGNNVDDFDAIEAVRVRNENNNVDNASKKRLGRSRRVQSAVEARNRNSPSSCSSAKEGSDHEENLDRKSCYVTGFISPSFGDDERDILKTESMSDDDFNKRATPEKQRRPDTGRVNSKPPDTQYNSNFMRATVMVTLKTNEIVKKAKAVVKKNRLHAPPGEKELEEEGDKWHTPIHVEHDRLTREITEDAERLSLIRNYLQSRSKQKTDAHEDNPNPEQKAQSGQGSDEIFQKQSSGASNSKLSQSTKDKDLVSSGNVSSKKRPSCEGIDYRKSSNEDLPLDTNTCVDDSLPPETIPNPNNDYIGTCTGDPTSYSKGGHHTDRYVIPKTVSPRQSISNEIVLQHKNKSSVTKSSLNSNPQTPLKTDKSILYTNELESRPRVQETNSSKLPQQSPVPRSSSNETTLSDKGKPLMTSQYINRPDSQKTCTPSNSNSKEVRTRTIKFRKAVRVRPVSAPVFNRQIDD